MDDVSGLIAEGNAPAPTLLLASRRRPDSSRRRQQEDRATELIAALAARRPRVARALYSFFSAHELDDQVEVDVATQVGIQSYGWIDLQLSAVNHPTVWIEAKVLAPETGQQLEKYSRFITTHQLEERYLLATLDMTGDAQAWTCPMDPARCKSWSDLVATLRDMLPPEVREVHDGPATLSEQHDTLPAEAADIIEFLAYLHDEGISLMTAPTRAEDLEVFQSWRAALDRLYGLVAGVRERVRAETLQGWDHNHLTGSKARRSGDGSITYDGLEFEWWWSFSHLPGVESWGIEMTLASAPFWLNEHFPQVGIAVGVTVPKSEPDFNDWLNTIRTALGERYVRFDYPAGRNSMLRLYKFIPLADHLEGSVEQQRASLYRILSADVAEVIEATENHPIGA